MSSRLANWQRRVKKRYMALAFLALILMIFIGVSTMQKDSYTFSSASAGVPERIELSREDIAEYQVREGRRELTFHAKRPGDVTVTLVYPGDAGEEKREYQLHVGEDLRLSAGRGRFPGDRAIIFSIMLMFAAGTFVSIYTSVEAHRKKPRLLYIRIYIKEIVKNE